MRLNLPFRSAYVGVVLALPLLVYVSVTVFWHSRGLYRITGDEPHYLLIAESLIRDHDLRVENNYLTDNPVQEAARLDFSRPASSSESILRAVRFGRWPTPAMRAGAHGVGMA